MLPLLALVPNWAKAVIVGLLLVVGLQVRHWWEVRGLKKDIRAQAELLEQEKRANADLRIGLSDVSANRDTLASQLREQSAAVLLLESRAKKAESAAALAATRVLEAGRRESVVLREDPVRVAPGHDAMNQWLQVRFAR